MDTPRPSPRTNRTPSRSRSCAGSPSAGSPRGLPSGRACWTPRRLPCPALRRSDCKAPRIATAGPALWPPPAAPPAAPPPAPPPRSQTFVRRPPTPILCSQIVSLMQTPDDILVTAWRDGEPLHTPKPLVALHARTLSRFTRQNPYSLYTPEPLVALHARTLSRFPRQNP